MGVAGYSEMAHMLGLYDVAEKYAGIAKKMRHFAISGYTHDRFY